MRVFAAGLAACVALALSACAAGPAAGPPAHRLVLAPYAAGDSAWSPEQMAAYLRSAARQLRHCGVRVETRAPQTAAADAPFDLRRAVRRTGPDDALPVFFVERLPRAEGEPIGGLALFPPPGPAVAVARTGPSGAVYAPEQTLAHEIGHAFGLAHAPARTGAGLPVYNVMDPVSCALCRFSEAQCAHLRAGIGPAG